MKKPDSNRQCVVVVEKYEDYEWTIEHIFTNRSKAFKEHYKIRFSTKNYCAFCKMLVDDEKESFSWTDWLGAEWSYRYSVYQLE